MRKHEGGRRKPGAALALAAMGGAMILALGGCGQSGPLYLPKESSLAEGVAVPATEPGVAAGPPGAVVLAPNRIAHG